MVSLHIVHVGRLSRAVWTARESRPTGLLLRGWVGAEKLLDPIQPALAFRVCVLPILVGQLAQEFLLPLVRFRGVTSFT